MQTVIKKFTFSTKKKQKFIFFLSRDADRCFLINKLNQFQKQLKKYTKTNLVKIGCKIE